MQTDEMSVITSLHNYNVLFLVGISLFCLLHKTILHFAPPRTTLITVSQIQQLHTDTYKMYVMTPIDQMSTSLPYGCWANTSGAVIQHNFYDM